MTTPKRRYIDELLDGIADSKGGPVSISLETAKRLSDLYEVCVLGERLNSRVKQFNSQAATLNDALIAANTALDEEIPEPKP